MKSNRDIEQELRDLGNQLTRQGSVVPAVLQRIEQEPLVPPRRAVSLGWFVRGAAAVAACVVLALALWSVFFATNGGSLYAQAAEALREARSIHAVSSRWQDGRWVKGAEIFYERGRGVKEWTQHRGKEHIRIDDGAREWVFSPDEPTVRKSPSRDLLGQAVRKILEPNRILERAKRDKSGDKVIDGDACRLYAHVHESGRMRYRVWVDAHNRIREFQEEKNPRGEQWEPDELSIVQYDVPIDAQAFVPQLPVDARIIEAYKTLDASFGLANVKYKQETEGLIFAVHRVEKLANGWYLVVSSLRPTEVTRAAIRNNDSGPAAWNYATLIMGTSFKRFDDDPNKMRSYVPYTLARVYQDGMDVHWTLFEPVGPWEIDPNMFELSWSFSGNGELAEKLQSQGKKARAEFRSVAQIPADRHDASCAEVASEVYDEVEALEPIVAMATLELKSIPFTHEEMEKFYRESPGEPRLPGFRLYHGRAAPPSKATREQFLAELDERIQQSVQLRGQ